MTDTDQIQKPVTRETARAIRIKFGRKVPVIKPTIQEVEPKKIYWHMGKVCEMLNVSPNTIRFWLKEFGVEIYRMTARDGYRKFSEQDIEKVQRIYHLLKIEGYTMEGAKRQWKLQRIRRRNG